MSLRAFRSVFRVPALGLTVLLFACGAAEEAPAQRAAIASAHPAATAAGMEILAVGGNAFDAAVAVSAALAVVEPYSSGLGGGGFYLLHLEAEQRIVLIDGRERAPMAATGDMFLDQDGNLDAMRVLEGPLAVAIPGTPAALAHIADRYGSLPLSISLAPAIRLARDGFAVDRRFADITVVYQQRLLRWCEPDCQYLEDGEPLTAGEPLVQPALAATLERLATAGAEGFYAGETARALLAFMRSRGGIWTAGDLSSYAIVEREPLIGEYRGHRVVTAPPPSSGGITLIQSLNVLDQLDLPAMDQAQRAHHLAETWRRTYRDRNEYLGDPDFVAMPLARLMSTDHAERLAADIDPLRATDSGSLAPVVGPREGETTSHFSVIDSQGNRVAATQTVNFRFGSGLVDPVSGVTMNNEMDDFSAQPGQPNGFGLVQGEANAVAPGRRPLSSMTPTFVEGPRGVAVLGTPGGSRIISMVTRALLVYVEGGDGDAMAALPRFHHQYLPDEIQFEPGAIAPEVQTQLRSMGHTLVERPSPFGNMNIVIWDAETETATASTDPRNSAYADY
jgi:gamma-glutamyltranspeptidase / glutathione hydrolase